MESRVDTNHVCIRGLILTLLLFYHYFLLDFENECKTVGDLLVYVFVYISQFSEYRKLQKLMVQREKNVGNLIFDM